VPGWHEATRELQAEGRIRTVGVVEEQHPDRARLFMQWKQMDWPVLVDALNQLDVAAVPITLLVDEYGVIRRRVPREADPAQAVREFLEQQFAPPELQPPAPRLPSLEGLRRAAAKRGAEGWLEYGEAQALWGREERWDRAIGALEQATGLVPDDGRAQFRLGVVYRMRYDSVEGQAADFSRAVAHWERALAIDPNQYIWRRRIEQYGPRLGKPYAFYDWVQQARAEIRARGEEPLALRIEPGGAELARPAEPWEAEPEQGSEPDPQGRVARDSAGLIRVQATIVPATAAVGASRVHLEFRPDPAQQAHWNNESRGLTVWVPPPDGWRVDRRRIELANPPQALSEEARHVEFELRGPTEPGRPSELRAYALYYVCQGNGGPCLYRRQDIPLELEPRVFPAPDRR